MADLGEPHVYDDDTQIQPGESSELESLYRELKALQEKHQDTRDALCALIGVMDFVIHCEQTVPMMSEVLRESKHVRRACDVVGAPWPGAKRPA